MTLPEPGRPTQRRAALPFILVVVFFDVLGIGLAMPVLPMLIGDFTANRELQSCWYGALVIVYGLMQFACAPLLGALSDRFGRRPVILASIFGLGLHYLLLALAPSLRFMLLARVMGGITGASFSVASAYASDVTSAQERARSFGLIGAAFGLGFIFGPMLGGILGSIDLHLPFYVAAGLSLANGLYGVFLVPESLPRDRRAPFSLRRVNPLASLLPPSRPPGIRRLVAAFALVGVAQVIPPPTWGFFSSL